MKITGEVIIRYSQKIYGFAFDKLRDPDKAEELSRDIILELLKAAAKGYEADNPDGYVYTVCRYAFARAMREKYSRRETADVNITHIPDGENIEENAERKLLTERLMREVTRLSKLHRQVTVMFYFDNIPGEEIARRLGIPHSTVRYYLGQSRKKLKEGIDMNENLSVDIVKISAGHNGYAEDMQMHGLGDNPLVANLAAACSRKPMTIEEISRKIGVGAAYLEYYLDDLIYMDYMKKVGNGYVINFWLRTAECGVKADNYAYVNAAAPAVKALEALQSRLDEILSIGFMGNTLDRDSLTWLFYGNLIRSLIDSAYSYPLDKGRKYYEIDQPRRADGSSHWVWAALTGKPKNPVPTAQGYEEYAKSQLSHRGVKTRSGEYGGQHIHSLQFDYGTDWREFDDEEITALCRIREIILSGETPSEHDKILTARMSEGGYVKVTEGVVRLNVPYMTKEEYGKYTAVLESICDELGRDLLLPYVKGMGKLNEEDIPDFLDSDLKFYYKYSNVYPQDFLHIIHFKQLLKVPEAPNRSGFCTLLYEE
ncbi:MAG: sigma-70 family RNA polymerase sigma factor [Ruminococcus sp.]|nr:sigma-70 family RNA polymerase sigma factor [Ruminococcus sp.]